MRFATVDLTTHLTQDVTLMAPCFKVVRDDATEFFFTGHDLDLTIGGDVYRSDLSFTATASASKSGLSVDNAELTLPLALDGISKADVIAGLFYRAELDVFWVNWNDLSMGVIYDAKGWRLGKATLKENQVVFEVRSKSALLNAPVLDTITPDCPYTFGVDDGYRSFCPAVLSNYDVTGTVTGQGGEVKKVFVDTARTEATDIYQYGVIRWDTGNNAGYEMEVESFTPATDTVTLLFNMPYDIEVGDTYTLWRGCDKRFATCQALGHYLDFGGEPNVPDQDTALQYQVS